MALPAHETAAAFGCLEGASFLVYTLLLLFIDVKREYPIDGTRVTYIQNEPSCIHSLLDYLVWLMKSPIFYMSLSSPRTYNPRSICSFHLHKFPKHEF